MKLQQFLQHHHLRCNPFTEEDAVRDPVFKQHCINSTFHPAWDKIYGDPAEPGTAIVFGEKGAGKTALRLQIAAHLRLHNQKHPHHRVWVIQYTDFNRFLDQFRNALPGRWREPAKLLSRWRLWDHLDAILSLATTELVDRLLGEGPQAEADEPLEPAALSRQQKRDLLLLALCYDQSFGQPRHVRWSQLARRLGFPTWGRFLAPTLGAAGTVLFPALAVKYWGVAGLLWPWTYAPVAASWTPWLLRCWNRWKRAWGIAGQVRVLNHETGSLWRMLQQLSGDDLAGQPLPTQDRTDDRYELLVKLQGVLRALGYTSVIVLVDRVDEPHLINGAPERMKELVWPLLDNKLLSHPGVGFKLLLPVELTYFIERESAQFHQRARLDKHNLIRSLEWTGESLLDVARDRLRACAEPGYEPNVMDLLDGDINPQRVVDAFASLRTPRNLFKFMYQLLASHCKAFPEEQPVWTISRERFETELALYQREQQVYSSRPAAV